MPGGPPNLWPLTPTAGRRRGRRSRSGTWPAAWAASTCTRTPRSRQAATTSLHGLQGADLVVAPLHVHQRGVGRGRRPSSCVGVDPTGVVDADDRVAPAAGCGRTRRTAECSTAASTTWVRPGSRCAPRHGGGDRLGGAAGEHDLAGRAPSSVGHLLAGLLDRDAGRSCPRRGCGPGSPGTDAVAGPTTGIASTAAGRSGEVEAWSR